MTAAHNPIQGAGTSLAQWQGSTALAGVPSISAAELLGNARRVLVVAPHPDDEVLGCGGWLQHLRGREADVLLISVTDGEASHPHSRQWPAQRLRRHRPLESRAALAALGLDVTALTWLRLGLADSAVAAAEAALQARLSELSRPGDCLLSTWRLDGHCDHEAVGRACAEAARRHSARLLEVPIWAWHWASPNDPRIPWARARKLLLDGPSLARKRRAIAAHASQTQADGACPPVLSDAALQRLLQPFELVFQ